MNIDIEEKLKHNEKKNNNIKYSDQLCIDNTNSDKNKCIPIFNVNLKSRGLNFK